MTARVHIADIPRTASRLLRAPFLKNVAVLASGTAMAQILTVLAYPILVRLFTPDQFGLFALFGALNMTIVVAASCRYELAIVLVRTEEEAANVLALTMAIVFAAVALTVVAVLLVGDTLLESLGYPELKGLIWFLPVAVLASTSNHVLSLWATRYRLYKRLSLATICRSFGVAAFQLVAGFAGAGVPGLVLGQIFGAVMATIVTAWAIIRNEWRSLWATVHWPTMKRLAREHRDFPLYSMPQALLNSTTITVPSILLAVLFNPFIAGLYWFTYRILEMPMTLLGDATRRVFYQRAVELFHHGSGLGPLFIRTSLALTGLVVVPTIVLIAAAPWIYEIAFGHDWREAGVYAQWIVGWWAMRFISLPSIMMVPVLNLQRSFLVLEALTLVPRLLVLPAAAWFADARTAIAAYSAVGFVFHLLLVVIVWRAVRRHEAAPDGDPASA